jgi:hypothetical protein
VTQAYMEDLYKRLDAAMAEAGGRRRRARPRTGAVKAWKYYHQVEQLRRSGMSPWRAVKEVARLNRKTPEHISACRKRVQDNYESFVIDGVIDYLVHR